MKPLILPFTVLILLLLSGLNPPLTIDQMVRLDLKYLKDFYLKTHQNPEISLEEEETSKALAEELRKVGYTVTENFGGFGIVGILKNGDGPTILYRTDMDALPMIEKTKLSYASSKKVKNNGTEVGVMHSCGHDMHMATWLGTARTLVKIKDKWKGTLMLIGQPAEEIGAGAKLMLEAGLYEKFGVPDYGIGLHCSPTLPAGQVGFGKGFTMANTESIDISVFGIGAHGASPHMSIDPIVVGSMIVMELQTIVSRSLKPTDAAVVTVGSIHGGTKHNIIPEKVKLQLTVRTYAPEVRKLVHQRIKEICKGIALSAGLPEDKLPIVTIPDVYTPANYNQPDLVDRMMSSAKKTIGEKNVVVEEPLMIGEDFSRYGRTSHKVPTVLYWLGTVPENRMGMEKLPGLHSPFYYPDIEKTLTTGVSVTTQSLLDLFNDQM